MSELNNKIEELKKKLKEREILSPLQDLKIRPYNPLCISNKYNEVIMEINHKGEIFWMNGNKLTKANVDKELTLAFIKVIEDLID